MASLRPGPTSARVHLHFHHFLLLTNSRVLVDPAVAAVITCGKAAQRQAEGGAPDREAARLHA